MKTRNLLFIATLLLICSAAISKESANGSRTTPRGTVNVFTSPDLFPLTTKWVSEYTRINPAVKIEVIQSEDKEIAGMLKSGSGIGFIRNESFEVINNLSAWNMVVGRDVIVPVMNATNPIRDEIIAKGITSEGLTKILVTPEKQNWGMLLQNSQNIAEIPVHFYVMNDPTVISAVESFLNTKQLNKAGIKMVSEQEIMATIQKDPNALVFCRLPQIVSSANQSIGENMLLVPIDKNGNGKIDYMEAIYSNLQEFSRGVWIGKYPKALSGSIHAVSAAKPNTEAGLSFLNWVLSDGQQLLTANGFSDLVLSEKQTQLAKINEPVNYTTAPANSYSLLIMILVLAVLLAITGFILDKLAAQRKSRAVGSPRVITPVFDQNNLNVPKGLYFDQTHTWAFMKKDGLVKIGIDDFLQHITGPLTRIEMKNSGDKIKKGEHLLTIIQKGKQLNIYSPVTGTITAHNATLLKDPSLLNNAPFTDGWVYLIEPANWLLELQFLTMAEKYKNWLAEEYLRLRDFFAAAVRIHAPAFAMVLQDGGVLRDGILADLGPEVWEDFQIQFMDAKK